MNSFLNDVAHIVFSKMSLVGVVLFALRLVVLTALEKRDPAHFVLYREALPKDIVAMLAIGFCVAPAADFLDRWIVYPPVLPE
jgi:hypothetical protein